MACIDACPLASPETGPEQVLALAVGGARRSRRGGCRLPAFRFLSIHASAGLLMLTPRGDARQGISMSLKKNTLAAALLLSLATPAAHAESAPDQNGTLAPVIVTATRTAITANEALSSVTVITREDIDRLQPVSIADLLTGLPGVSIGQTGGIGQQTSLYLRGTNATHVLVLIDGIRVGSVSIGLPAMEQVPVQAIDRIEIVRGPRASLYGSDALSGVINVIPADDLDDAAQKVVKAVNGR